MKRQTCHINIHRHPNTSLRQLQEGRIEAANNTARTARPVVVQRWLDGTIKFADDAQPLHRAEDGKLDYAAARTAVERARRLGLIG